MIERDVSEDHSLISEYSELQNTNENLNEINKSEIIQDKVNEGKLFLIIKEIQVIGDNMNSSIKEVINQNINTSNQQLIGKEINDINANNNCNNEIINNNNENSKFLFFKFIR